MSNAEKLNTPVRLYLFIREDGFYPIPLPSGTVVDNAEANPGTLSVVDAETNREVWKCSVAPPQ